MTRTSLGVLVPYFGLLPNYFDLWLESCRHNNDIDWIFVTDRSVPFDVPPNVHVVRTTFGDFVARMGKSFDFDLALTVPYKLCDFRPAFGEVFRHDLGGYDFWGYCDVDVVFGDIRRFVTEEVLTSADKVFTGGHLSFIRNVGEINRTYRQGRQLGLLDYREVLSSPKPFAFDEWGVNHDGLNSIFLANDRHLHLSEMPYADIKVRHHALRTNREDFSYSPQTAEEERRKHHIAYTFKQGTLVQHAIDSATGEVVEREEAYIHLQKRPMRRAAAVGESPSSFAIVPPNKFVEHPSLVDVEYLEKNSRDHRFYLHYHRLRWESLRRRVRR